MRLSTMNRKTRTSRTCLIVLTTVLLVYSVSVSIAHEGHGHSHSHSEHHHASEDENQPKHEELSEHASEESVEQQDYPRPTARKVDFWPYLEPDDGRPHEVRKTSKFYKKQKSAKVEPVQNEPSTTADFTSVCYALTSTLMISAAPITLLYLIPVQNTAEYEPTLTLMVGFASGSLLGDAFLHLLPHSKLQSANGHPEHSEGSAHSHNGHSHSHDQSEVLNICSWALIGMVTFMLLDQVVRSLSGDDGHGHAHGQVHLDDAAGDRVVGVVHSKVYAYLNLLADVMHNWTDGLAIGASYLVDTKVGHLTSLTILFHEVPHEIGDLAILMQAGYSKTQAIGFQLMTAVGALVGTFIGIYFAGPTGGSSWILPFTAGGFIHIACASIILEMKQNRSLLEILKFNCSLILGIALMGAITLFE